MEENKRSKINIEVELTKDNTPENLYWKADDDPEGKGTQEAKAMLLSFFDRDTLETVKIDLWTNDFQIQEMDRLVFQSMRSLTETYFKATKNQKMASAMQQFVQFFGEETGIIPKDES